MRLRTVILCSVSAGVLASAPAFAQTSPTLSTSGAPAPGQEAASTTPGATDDASTSQDIVVTGIRRSLQSAQNIKRNSVQIVDSIVAEDIGKLPDVSISDVAARIPGIEVERSGGEAGRVLLRGLDNNYYTTTYNSRDIFTAEARAVALQDFPAGGIAALEVFKTTTADLVEGGIAGEVNVRSRRPFDFDKPQIAGSFWGQYEKRSHKFDPNGNLLLTDRWTTGMGEVGALINFSYTSLHYVDSARSNTDFIATDGTPYRFPDIQRLDFAVGHRERPSINGSLQWRPSPKVELYFDGLWQGFRNAVSDREYSFFDFPIGPQTQYSNIQTRPGTNLLDSYTVANSNRPEGFQGATFGKTDTFQFAIGGKYDGGPFKLNADLARTRSKFTNSIYSFDTNYTGPVTINAVPAGATFTVPNFDATNAANYDFRGFFDRRQIAKGDDYQGRIDATYDFGADSILQQFQAGFRYVDRHGSYAEGARYANYNGAGVPLTAVPGISLGVFQSGFPDDDPIGIKSYITPTYTSIRDNIAKIRQYVGFPAGDPPLDPTLSYNAHEKSYAGYGQLKYQIGHAGGVQVDGAIGLRVVRTELSLVGTGLTNGVLTPVNDNRNYTDWLPNASARLRFTDQVQLRLSATRTRTRPSFTQYNPSVSVGTPFISTRCPGNAATCTLLGGNGGNPNLDTIRSDNYDASLEYYFTRTGFVSLGVFDRELKGFIQTQTGFTTSPNFAYPIQGTAPFNTSSGRIRGFEAQFNTFFDADFVPSWARAFGIQANLTYLDTNLKYPAASNDPLSTLQVSREIVGVSKWTYNIDGFYEHGGLTARLSYNWRSSFLFEPFCCGPYRDDPGFAAGDNGPRLFVDRARPVGRLDFSASYDVNRHFTLTADATNLLAKPLRVEETTYSNDGLAPAAYPRVVRYEESVYSLGFRFRF